MIEQDQPTPVTADPLAMASVSTAQKVIDARRESHIWSTFALRPIARASEHLLDDTALTSAVRSKLAWSRFSDGLIVDVCSEHGEVSLAGSAATEEDRAGAGMLAMSTHGVHSVSNKLVIRSHADGVLTRMDEDIADSWITNKVQSTFKYSICALGMEIAVMTRAGIVSLSGKVENDAERTLAIELAGNVRGVKGVDSTSLTM